MRGCLSEEWEKGDVQGCSNYRGIKLNSNAMKLWEGVVNVMLRKEMTISEQQCSFMLRNSTTDVVFTLRVLRRSKSFICIHLFKKLFKIFSVPKEKQ